MDTALTTDPRLFRSIYPEDHTPPQQAGVPRLARMAHRVNELAEEVEECWETFPEKRREALKDFVYSAMEPPRGIVGQWYRLRAAAWIARTVYRGEAEELREFMNASVRLGNAILDAIERENTAYQEDLDRALKEALAEDRENPGMSAEEARERTRDIFRRAVE